MKKIVINTCFGGFGLSDAAYEKLIEWGIPCRKYIEEKRGEDKLFIKVPENEGQVIFDRSLSDDKHDKLMMSFGGRYWETWIRNDRTNPLLIKVVEELGEKANGNYAALKIIEIPDDIEYEIEDYDGSEHVAEVHRTWS